METATVDPRFPIGKYRMEKEVTPAKRAQAIEEIAAAPAKMREALAGLKDAQLDTPYRDGGWTLRQVAHHVPDSHMNAYVRWKLALTETEPTIKPYDEAAWATLVDSKMPVAASLDLLRALHERWVALIRGMKEEDFARTFKHPDHPGVQTVDWMLFLYAWHGRHHVAHIMELRKRKGW
ncbi:MAG TPA: putative metal-dependent hydrolase [Candidatus Acidoferrum sp.]|nr:putative metal-dependent hydrolase [Candidatus Acidoferrum sp.]